MENPKLDTELAPLSISAGQAMRGLSLRRQHTQQCSGLSQAVLPVGCSCRQRMAAQEARRPDFSFESSAAASAAQCMPSIMLAAQERDNSAPSRAQPATLTVSWQWSVNLTICDMRRQLSGVGAAAAVQCMHSTT